MPFILVINFKIPTSIGIFKNYDLDKFPAQVSLPVHEKSFIISVPGSFYSCERFYCCRTPCYMLSFYPHVFIIFTNSHITIYICTMNHVFVYIHLLSAVPL